MSSVISLKIHIIVQIDAESTHPTIAAPGRSFSAEGGEGVVTYNKNPSLRGTKITDQRELINTDKK
jgi:hypothetical protein